MACAANREQDEAAEDAQQASVETINVTRPQGDELVAENIFPMRFVDIAKNMYSEVDVNLFDRDNLKSYSGLEDIDVINVELGTSLPIFENIPLTFED